MAIIDKINALAGKVTGGSIEDALDILVQNGGINNGGGTQPSPVDPSQEVVELPLSTGTGENSLIMLNDTSPNTASGDDSVAIGRGNTASGRSSFVSGESNTAIGNSSACFGYRNTAGAERSLALGLQCHSSGSNSFAGGDSSKTVTPCSFAFGTKCFVYGSGGGGAAFGENMCSSSCAFSCGYGADHTIKITGEANATVYTYSQNSVEILAGCYILYNNILVRVNYVNTSNHTIMTSGTFGEAVSSASAQLYVYGAFGNYSQAEGLGVSAYGSSQHVFGQYNVPDGNNTYSEIVGNGHADNIRSNARTLDWYGNETLAGSITLGEGTEDQVTLTAADLRQLLELIGSDGSSPNPEPSESEPSTSEPSTSEPSET